MGRNFRITESLPEKHGRTEGCPGCEADTLGESHRISGSARRHIDECRASLVSQMTGTEDNVRIRRRVRQSEEEGHIGNVDEKPEEEDEAMAEEEESKIKEECQSRKREREEDEPNV